MRHLFFASLVLAAAATAVAGIQFVPPNPAPGVPVEAIVNATWPTTCVPTAAAVEVSTLNVRLRLMESVPPDGTCRQVATPFSSHFEIGALPAGGIYFVVATAKDRFGSVTEVARQSLIVRMDDYLDFDPPGATAHKAVDAVVSGWWPDGCIPKPAGLQVSGSTVTVSLDAVVPEGMGCTALFTRFASRFHLHVLDPGIYTVVAVLATNDGSGEYARRTLVVRDDESIELLPFALPVSGGAVRMRSRFDSPGATVTVGGATVPLKSAGGYVTFDAPPHSAGAVDVVVDSGNGETRSAKAALIYYEAAAVDPAIFEPIIFPLSFEGAGAFGSMWATESFIDGSDRAAYFRDPLPCPGCTEIVTIGTKQLANDGAPYGHVMYALRGTTEGVTFASRIRDISRQAESAGTRVPIVREGDFRAGDLVFLNVPTDRRYRAMLRLWAISDVTRMTAQTDALPSDASAVTINMTKVPGTNISFGAVDVTDALYRAAGPSTDLRVSKFSGLPVPAWGMLSITNNDTQQVTIVTSH